MVGYLSTEFDPVFNPMWRQGRFVVALPMKAEWAVYRCTNSPIAAAVLHAIQWLRYSIGEVTAYAASLLGHSSFSGR